MKYFITALFSFLLVFTLNAQQPSGPITVEVPGEFVSTTTTTWPDGTSEDVIVCICNPGICYYATIINGIVPSEDFKDDCAGTGLNSILGSGSQITAKLPDGTTLVDGILISYTNYPSGVNPLERNHRFVTTP
jgi:hypothetical protein